MTNMPCAEPQKPNKVCGLKWGTVRGIYYASLKASVTDSSMTPGFGVNLLDLTDNWHNEK